MNANLTNAENPTKPPLKKYFHCRSCGRDRPIEQLGKITKGNNSKRCQFYCANAMVARALIAQNNAPE